MPSTAETVVTGLLFPEGPVWCDDGTVVCTAVAEGALYRIQPRQGTKTRIALTGGGANAAAPTRAGGFLVTQNGGVDFAAWGIYDDPPPFRPTSPGIQCAGRDGAVRYVSTGNYRAPNDLVTAADGTVFFTDPPARPTPGERLGRIHAMDRSGTTRVLAADFEYCNGIALGPDGTIVVVEGRGLMHVGVDGSKDWVTPDIGPGGGDGLCIDLEGNFYVAATADHGIRVLSPDGRPLDFLAIPPPSEGPGITTNCCFGGSDGRTLFATDGLPGQLVAWEHMPAAGRTIHPWPGPSA